MKKRLVKCISVLLVLLLAVSNVAVVSAEDAAFACVSIEPITCSAVNPAYAGAVAPQLSVAQYAPQLYASQDVPESAYETTLSDLAEEVREEMQDRDEQFDVYYKVDIDDAWFVHNEDDLNTFCNQLFELVFAESDDPTAGDYLRYSWNRRFVGLSGHSDGYSDDLYLEFAFSLKYYTTKTQEDRVDDKIDDLVDDFSFTATTTKRQKTDVIYKYITDHVTYDYENLNDSNYTLKFSAYAALINGTSVCEGYAVLFYRLAEECGLDARVITGSGGNTRDVNHAWNIVKIGSCYYYVDATWDAETEGNYRYYLKGSSDFDGHTNEDKFETETFKTMYPMAEAAVQEEYNHIYNKQNYDSNEHWMECECGVRDLSSYQSHQRIDMYDDTHHWKECNFCGYVYVDTRTEHTTTGYFNLNDELHCRSCTCGKYLFETAESHTAVRSDADDTYHWDVCVCGATFHMQKHTYTISKKNDTEHWNECVCGKQEFDYRYGHGYTRCFDKNKHWLECACGAKTDLEAHTFGSYRSNSTQHWKECWCGATTAKANHTYTNACDTTCNNCGAKRSITHTYKTTTTKATTSKNGSIVKKCGVCGTKTQTIIYSPKTLKLSTTSYTYNGSVKTPSVTVKNSKGNTLKKNTDYTVKYPSGRKYVGKYTVTITFKGNYSGTKTLSFTINPKGTSVSKVTAGKKSLKVTIKKQSSQTTGYQIEYSTSKKFSSKYTKSTTVSNKTISKTIKSLKSKKTYYVRVRTYKTVGVKKYYSGWSTVKANKTK